MKAARMATGPLLGVILLTTLYLPKRGQIALDENSKKFQRCSQVIIDWAPAADGEVPSNGCFERYMERREQIQWRYFLVQTLAARL
jgi:hypothetical protein